jgi:phage tail-like protein
MSEISKNNFVFLNHDGRWPGFKCSGLEIREDGALQLSSVPLFSGTLPAAIQSAPTPDGPAGLAIDVTGTLYFSDPDGNCVQRILSCDSSVCAATCMGRTGSVPTTFHAPRGLLIPRTRPSLFVADTENNRIQVFDLDSFQLVEIWGQTNANASQAGSQPGQFNTPWTLAADSSGNVYVVDYGNQRVQKFNAIGQVDAEFWQTVQASGLLTQPADITVREENGAVWVLVIDSASAAVYIFDANGKPVLNPQSQPLVIKGPHLTQPMGIAAAGDAVYVGDNAAQRVLRFQIGDGAEYIGAAIGYQGPIAALLLDRNDNLWVHSGGSLTPTQLFARGGYDTLGSLWIDLDKPLEISNNPVVWHRLQALASTVPADAPNAQNAHLDLYACSASDLSQAPTVDPVAANPFSDPRWQAILPSANLDVTELYIGGCKTKYLWIGALFSGDGMVSPKVHQLRAEFNYPSYAEHLPSIYTNSANCGEFLPRLLSLFESLFSGVEYEIDLLAALFDPQATPKSFLAWLAGCMGLDLDDNWDEQKQRQIIARIFELSGRRGTPAGLRESLHLFAGVDATIEEPLLNASWWALPTSDSCCQECAASDGTGGMTWQSTQNSVLGWTTMLAPAQPQGAVVGTSAVLDQSQLITDDEFGSPLFTDVAYQFSVLLYRSQVMCPEAIANIRAIVDQEKPAHTAYHLCVIDPLFRVGFQSRLGIDTVVAGPPRSLSLGTDQALGVESVLAGAAPSLLGDGSRLGVDTRLG